jgi:hypothetical protein
MMMRSDWFQVPTFWRRLRISPAMPNEYLKLKLLGAWKPPNSQKSLPDAEGEEAQFVFLNGNQIMSQ